MSTYVLKQKILVINGTEEDYLFDLPLPEKITFGQIKHKSFDLQNPFDAGFEMLKIAGGLSDASANRVSSADTIEYYKLLVEHFIPVANHGKVIPEAITNGQLIQARKVNPQERPYEWLDLVLKSVLQMPQSEIDALPVGVALGLFADLAQVLVTPKSGS